MKKTEEISKTTPLYTISTVAELLGVSVQTLRMYERENLILPYKKDSKHRLYSQADLERLECIRKAIIEQKFSIPAIRTIYSLIPCWNIIKCSDEIREKCDAYNSHSQPCWTFRHFENSCECEDCRLCTVYNDYSTCEKIKEGLKKL